MKRIKIVLELEVPEKLNPGLVFKLVEQVVEFAIENIGGKIISGNASNMEAREQG